MNVFCVGFGTSAQRFATLFGEDYFIAGSVRTPEKAEALQRQGFQASVFDGQSMTPECRAALLHADALLVSAPPGEGGDGYAGVAEVLQEGSSLKTIVYLSTVGVYGDRDGAWVSEKDPATPMQPRSIRRLHAEKTWQALGQQCGATTIVMRLSGIYGPGQNAVDAIRHGHARCIVKPGQVFNRIHVDDIARVVNATLRKPESAIYNVSDNEPAPPQDVVLYAAKLLGAAPPPEVDWQQAGLSPMGLSFYEENKRISNALLRATFGEDILLYPTYREGLKSFL
jgi:nucleoside-diphosphate-sugar epimerase